MDILRCGLRCATCALKFGTAKLWDGCEFPCHHLLALSGTWNRVQWAMDLEWHTRIQLSVAVKTKLQGWSFRTKLSGRVWQWFLFWSLKENIELAYSIPAKSRKFFLNDMHLGLFCDFTNVSSFTENKFCCEKDGPTQCNKKKIKNKKREIVVLLALPSCGNARRHMLEVYLLRTSLFRQVPEATAESLKKVTVTCVLRLKVNHR